MRVLFMLAILAVMSGTYLLFKHDKLSTRLSCDGCIRSTHQITTPWALDENLRVVIPPSMILIGSSLLWCPNAKSGTSMVYKVLWTNKIMKSGNRCQGCPMKATNKLKSWSTSKPISFVIVRNPYARIRSAYVGKIQTKKIKVRDVDNRPIMRFYEFIKYVKTNPTKDIHWSPVSSRCLTGTSNSTEGVFQYDYILKLEDDNVPQKLRDIFQRAGIDLPVGIENAPVNQNTDHALSAIVDFYREAAAESNVAMEELIGLVAEIYRDDIDQFGYSFPKY